MSIDQLKLEIYKLIPSQKEIIIDYTNDGLIVSMGTSGSEHEFYIVIKLNENFSTIMSYSVAHKNRGTGLGSKLYDLFEEYIKSCGYKEIRLHLVLTGAEKFWKKKGFTIKNREWIKNI